MYVADRGLWFVLGKCVTLSAPASDPEVCVGLLPFLYYFVINKFVSHAGQFNLVIFNL